MDISLKNALGPLDISFHHENQTLQYPSIVNWLKSLICKHLNSMDKATNDLKAQSRTLKAPTHSYRTYNAKAVQSFLGRFKAKLIAITNILWSQWPTEESSHLSSASCGRSPQLFMFLIDTVFN